MSYRQRSFSQHSIPSFLVSETEDISDEELIKQVNDLKLQVRVFRIENEVLERMITRVDPSLLVGLQQTVDYALKLRCQSTASTHASSFFMKSSSSKLFPENTLTSYSRTLFSPSRISTRKVESSARMTSTVLLGGGPKINLVERSEIVSTEMEMIMKRLEKEKKISDKQHALLKAQLEELTLRLSDVEKAVEIFNSDVIVKGWDDIAQRIPAEEWVKFMRDWVKTTDTVIGKLRLRTSTLNSQYLKLKGQIKAKADLSESLRPVDFDQLKIQNSQIINQINTKVKQLIELKKMTGEANLNLTVHKKALFVQNNYLISVQKSIKDKEIQTVALDKERDVIQGQVDSLAEQLDEVRTVRQAYQVPDVMDYVNVKSQVTDLKNIIKVLENRVRIHQIALASINRKLRSVLNEKQ